MFAAKDLFFDSGASGYQISRSVRLRSSASAYFQRTPASAGNRQKYTWSGWVKRGIVAAGTYYALFTAGQVTGGDDGLFFDTTAGALYFTPDQGATSTLISSSLYRDPSAWYHIVLAVDTTQATSTNRIKMYVNGVQLTSFSTATYPAQNLNSTFINTANIHRIGAHTNAGFYYDGYLTEINFIDGQQLTPSNFGATNTTTGVWGPARYTGTYGTNGFYLNFSDNSAATAAAIGKDSSGNGNNWTPNNISVTAGVTYDSMVDTPTPYGSDTGVGGEVRGNYPVMNPVVGAASGSSYTITQGNLNTVLSSSTNVIEVPATMALPTSGQWYWEVNVVSVNTTFGNPLGIGISDQGGVGTASSFTNNYYYYVSKTGNKNSNGTSTAYGATFTANDVIGVAFDATNGTLTFYKNNTSQGTAYTGLTAGPYYPKFGSNDGSTFVVNFGQRPFSYTAPSGYKALNTQNLSTPTIANGAGYMNATLYNGNSSTQTVNNSAGFYPDFNWIKIRSGAGSHVLADSVRGGSKQLFSNLTNAEQTDTNMTSAISSSGIALGNNSTGTGNSNITGSTYVLWQWLAGAGSSSSNTSGSITSTVSVNTTAGFSVVSFTGNGAAGATIGHGLGVVPSMIILKERSPDTNYNWFVYHTSVGNTAYLLLNTSNASSSGVSAWNNTTPTSSVFTVGSYTEVNKNTAPFIAYCFAPIAGYSAFGSYTGNGAADGPFIYTGFRPRWVLVKNYDLVSGENWYVIDSSRNTYNVASSGLFPNLTNAEGGTNVSEDFLSNGFKIRATGTPLNNSGGAYIYAAFAENPFKYALAR